MLPVSERSDAELLEAWRAGSAGAGNALFERHFEIVRRFFATKVSDTVAEDLIQETFVACMSARERIQESSSFRGYLLGIARYVLIAHYKRARKQRGEADDGEPSALRDGGASPSAYAADREEQRALLAALRSLPLDQQIALELHYWEELGTEEIASVVGIPQGTVKSRLRLAREALKRHLEAHEPPDVAERTVTNLDAWARGLREVVTRRPPE
jgi:RNA polymerase sigma factor (sigma-70 family)